MVGCLKLKRMKYPPLPFLRDEKDVLSIVISITGLFFCVCVSGKSEKNPFSSFYKENVTFSAPREFDMRKSCYWGGGVARISALRLARTYFD